MSPNPGEKAVSVKINDEFISRLDALAERAGISRHKLMQNILSVAVEELEKLANIGMFQLGILIRDIRETVGRPALIDKASGDKVVPIWIDENILIRLDKLAEKGGLSRNKFVQNLLQVGVQELEHAQSIGLFQFAVLLIKLRDGFIAIGKTGEKAFRSAMDGK